MLYPYPLADPPYAGKLHKEIAAVLEISPKGVSYEGGVCRVRFDQDLAADKVTALDGVVADHVPTKDPERRLIAPATLIRQAVAVANETEWEGLAGVIAKPDFFAPQPERLAKVVGHVLGQFFCVGGGAEIQLIEDIYGMGQYVSAITAVYAAADTQGTWQILSFFTNRPPANGANLYELQARRNGAADLKVRNTSMSLFELV